MKKLSKLRLTQLSMAELEARQMNALKGGQLCTCSCYYVNDEGSPSGSNSFANYNLGTNGGYSTAGYNQFFYDDEYGVGNNGNLTA